MLAIPAISVSVEQFAVLVCYTVRPMYRKVYLFLGAPLFMTCALQVCSDAALARKTAGCAPRGA